MARTLAVLVVAALVVGCGGMGGGGDASMSPTFMISAAGLSPSAVEVMSGACVAFQNMDATAHEVTADDASVCPELMQAPSLAPGMTWSTCLSMGPKTCSFHDGSRMAATGAPDLAFAGTIQIDASMDMMPSM